MFQLEFIELTIVFSTFTSTFSTGIEPEFLATTESLKQIVLIIRLQFHAKGLKNRKYIDRLSNSVASGQKIVYDL